MCGTPLPHAPLTAPGAHSTLSFTRSPLDGPAGTETQRVPVSHTRTGATGVIEMPASGLHAGESPHSEETVDSAAVSAVATSDAAVNPVEEQPVREMVPEVPLDAYIREFRYVPPSEPEEVDMRGEAAAVEPEVPATDQSAPASAGLPVISEEAPPESGDVQERLGLVSAETSTDEPPRPRFLDVNQPLAPPVRSSAPPPATVSPSFLELSDLRPAPAAEADTSSPRRWGTWLAGALALMFAALGVAEWRAKVNQNPHGPLEIIQMKIQSLRQRGRPDANDNQAAPTTASSGADPGKPAAAVAEQVKPQGQGLPTADVNPPLSANAAAAKAPPNAQNRGASEIAGKAKPPAAQALAPAKPAISLNAAKPVPTQPAAEKPIPGLRSGHSSDQEVATEGTIPGGQEMTKANNASDKAAEAAWLWKATAKGNPDAPVQLAELYVKGDGVPRSCEQAVVLLKTAAGKENARARNRLAAMYSTGTCVQRNRVQAYHWLSSALAADPNSQWAQQNRDVIWQQMTPEERAQAEKDR